MRPSNRWDLPRWLASIGAFSVPQAAAPIAFTLLALPITGSARSGAAMLFAMTLSQVLAAVPASRLGARIERSRFLRLLLGVRAAALIGVTLLGATHADFRLLVLAAFVAGTVNGAAYGYQRALLSEVVASHELPRALGMASTLTEVTFATSPLLASALGALSPVLAMSVITFLGALPIVVMPRANGPEHIGFENPSDRPSRIPTVAFLWMFCALAISSAVSALEVGAVGFALAYNYDPEWGFLIALAVGTGSVLGGIVVSVRNRAAAAENITALFAASALASSTILLVRRLPVTLSGAALLGFLLPFVVTYISLVLDAMSPRDRRVEAFALQRVASALGVIAMSGLVAAFGLRAAMATSCALMVAASTLIATRSRQARLR